MDRTILNLTSLLIGGAGLLTALTEFNVPQLNMSFLGQNPFAIKRDTIQTVLNWIFSSVALSALVLQLWAEVWGDYLPRRLHGWQFYVALSVLGLVVVALLVWLLTSIGYHLSRRFWMPKVVSNQREIFRKASFVVNNGGIALEHYGNDDLLRNLDIDSYKTANLSDAERQIGQIEDLLEVQPAGELTNRINRLAVHFD